MGARTSKALPMIAIRVVSRAGRSPETPLVARFGSAGGDIGRAPECTLVLADADRRISRRQALISCRGERHFIRQVGANLEVSIGNEPLAPDTEHELEDGTELRIGSYVLRVEAERAAVDEDSRALLSPRARPSRASAFADLLDGDAARRPLAAQDIDVLLGTSTGANAAHAPPEDPLGAFFAGLRIAAPPSASPRTLHAGGELLREMVAGTLELLAARSAAKRELGAEQTQVRRRENNPFKFAPDADEALALLLGAPEGSFMAAPAAAREAFGDLRAHQIAVLAGMRAALDAVLARFDPTALARRLAGDAGLWDSLLPVAGKARLWEQYVEHYAEILHEVEGDFDAAFGRAFLQAYRAQLAALAGGAGDDADAPR
jgi:FHA domain-containing protein